MDNVDVPSPNPYSVSPAMSEIAPKESLMTTIISSIKGERQLGQPLWVTITFSVYHVLAGSMLALMLFTLFFFGMMIILEGWVVLPFFDVVIACCVLCQALVFMPMDIMLVLVHQKRHVNWLTHCAVLVLGTGGLIAGLVLGVFSLSFLVFDDVISPMW